MKIDVGASKCLSRIVWIQTIPSPRNMKTMPGKDIAHLFWGEFPNMPVRLTVSAYLEGRIDRIKPEKNRNKLDNRFKLGVERIKTPAGRKTL